MRCAGASSGTMRDARREIMTARNGRRNSTLAATLALILAGAGANAAWGQQPLPRIWDMQLGTPVGELPEEEFVDPACGTNGGPPGLRIGSFEQFERCRAEASGLREIWFRYDDELESIARPPRAPEAGAPTNALGGL